CECGSGLVCDAEDSCVSACSGADTWCGACVDTSSDGAHCGGCDRPCAAGEVCSSGACELDCGTGLLACADACVDPQTSNQHCGASDSCVGSNAGAVCTSPSSCVDGSCELVCSGGQINCNSTCIDPATDMTFCGASGNCVAPNNGSPCASGYACEAGVCRQQCEPGLVSCDGECINPSSDEAH